MGRPGWVNRKYIKQEKIVLGADLNGHVDKGNIGDEEIIQDMYDGSQTVVRCAVGITESFKLKVGLHQGSALSPFLFAVIIDRLTDEVRREPPWMMLFADNIVICEETREEVEQKLES